MSPVNGDNLLKHECEEKSATRTKNGIVKLEEEGELLGLTCLHDLANAEDGGKIASKNAEDNWLCRKGRRATYIMSQVVGQVRNGGMFEKKVRKRSHDERKAGRRNTSRRESCGPLRTAPAPKSSGHDRNLKICFLG